MICGDRTIKVQFIGSDGKPIAGRTVTLTQGGLMLTETATDDNGCIFLYGNDFANGVPVRTQIADAPGLPRYCEADFTIDLDENDYALIYYERRKKIAWWLILIFIVGILLAAINIWGAVETDIN
ncbi:MAG: hypothetical protein K2G06_06575, partial [Muribaculaceae bacterium]|nr:hypothetical protein [Muribaculaceae bacterium]